MFRYLDHNKDPFNFVISRCLKTKVSRVGVCYCSIIYVCFYLDSMHYLCKYIAAGFSRFFHLHERLYVSFFFFFMTIRRVG